MILANSKIVISLLALHKLTDNNYITWVFSINPSYTLEIREGKDAPVNHMSFSLIN